MTAPRALVPEPRRAAEVVPPVQAQAPEPARRPRRSTRLLAGTLLNLAALLGLSMFGLTAYAATHQLHPLVVRSGSMEPTIHTGSMVLVKTIPASAIRVGDIVAAKRPDGVTVTHRVQSLRLDGGLAELVLKGDANKAQDPAPVVVASAGRVVWTAPVVGRLAAFTASSRGGFVMGCLVMLTLLSLRRRSP